MIPTTLNHQEPDMGPQYRKISGIIYNKLAQEGELGQTVLKKEKL